MLALCQLSVSAQTGKPSDVGADLIAVPMFKGGIEGPGAGEVRTALGLDEFPATPDFRGDIGQHLLLTAPGLAASGVLLVGLGRMDAVDPEQLRRAAGVAARAAKGFARVATTLAEVHPTPAAVQAVAEGFHLGAYADQRHRTVAAHDQARLAEVVVLVPSRRLDDAHAAIKRAAIYAQATIAARDLVNLPPDRKRPPALADALRELCKDSCEVLIRDEDALAAQGFGGILGVGRGSSEPPRLVELRYRPSDPIGHVVLVGKGITFDTGGLSLKRGKHMNEMKSDMAGAAAVAAVCAALSQLGVRLSVTGLCALAENMPGADAQRPDDVLRIYNGKTVEVRDTDAEGRLVLADALAYGATLEADAMVDLATLTGSVVTALGSYAAAVMGTDDELIDALRAGAARAGESLWPLPLWRDLDRFLETPVADLNNTGDGGGGGAIIGGLFLKRFAGETPWAHMDIAGPAFLDAALARHYLTAGGTGYGVRTLLSWLEHPGA